MHRVNFHSKSQWTCECLNLKRSRLRIMTRYALQPHGPHKWVTESSSMMNMIIYLNWDNYILCSNIYCIYLSCCILFDSSLLLPMMVACLLWVQLPQLLWQFEEIWIHQCFLLSPTMLLLESTTTIWRRSQLLLLIWILHWLAFSVRNSLINRWRYCIICHSAGHLQSCVMLQSDAVILRNW